MDELISDKQFINRISRYINSGDTQKNVMVQSLEILRLSGRFNDKKVERLLKRLIHRLIDV